MPSEEIAQTQIDLSLCFAAKESTTQRFSKLNGINVVLIMCNKLTFNAIK